MSGLLAHEWVENIGGAEFVLENMYLALDAPNVFTLWSDTKSPLNQKLQIRESWLAKSPLRKSKALSLPFMSQTWRHSKFENYDWVLASSHLFAHHICSNPSFRDSLKFSYVHTPARYIWEPNLDQRLPANRITDSILDHYKKLDKKMSQSSQHLAANSNFISQRMEKYWGAENIKVIYPPVDINHFRLLRSRIPDENLRRFMRGVENLPAEFLLAGGRLVPYKRIDLSIKVASVAKLPIVVVGTGPEYENLQKLAAELEVRATFLGNVSDEQLVYLYSKALAYLALAVEDFGIMAVEAIAAGAKVIANSVGGHGETVLDGLSGFTCDPNDILGCAEVIDLASRTTLRNPQGYVEKFKVENFRHNIREWVFPDNPGENRLPQTL